MILLMLISGVCAWIYLIRYCHAAASWPKTLVKTLAVMPLALIAVLSGGPVLLAAALVLCGLGDYLLSRDTQPMFITGVAAFAAGHLAYVAMFLSHPMSDVGRLAWPEFWPLTVLLAVFGMAMMRLLFAHAGALRFAVIGYIPVILAMALAALTVPMQGALTLVLPAAALFLLSDTVLSLQEFVLPHRHRARRFSPFLIWSTYWLAQFGLLMGLSGWLQP